MWQLQLKKTYALLLRLKHAGPGPLAHLKGSGLVCQSPVMLVAQLEGMELRTRHTNDYHQATTMVCPPDMTFNDFHSLKKECGPPSTTGIT